MLYAVKGNREEVITEDRKQEYLSEGYDIYSKDDGDDKAKLLEKAKGAKVSYKEHKKVLDELAAANERIAELEGKNKKPLSKMNGTELKALAEEHEIVYPEGTTVEALRELVKAELDAQAK